MGFGCQGKAETGINVFKGNHIPAAAIDYPFYGI